MKADRFQLSIWIILACVLSLFLLAADNVPETAAAAQTPEFPTCSPIIIPFDPGNTLPFASLPIPKTTSASAPTLRLLADKYGLWVGTSVAASLLDDPEYASLLVREFNMVVPEVDMKWEVIHPEVEGYDFSKGDTIVAFAEAHRMAVHGHVLVWEQQLPPYIQEAEYSRQEWIETLCVHVKTIVTHYRGRIQVWDVINEALDDQGILRDTIWLRTIGPEYIAMAFHWAHEADPQALLVYNESRAEGLNRKSQAVYALVQGLLNLNVPIHAVGMQLHTALDVHVKQNALQQNMKRLSDLGLQVYITEMDVRLQYSDRSPQDKLIEQAKVYRLVFSACLANPLCKMFETWGLTDRYSWIPDYTGKDDAPLLFDREGNPKPAYDAIMQLLTAPQAGY